MRSGSRFGVEPQGQAQLIVGLLSPATLLDILRDYVVYEPERGRLVKKLPRYQQYRAVRAALGRLLSGRKPEERGGVVWHTQGSGKSLTMLWLATKVRRESRLAKSRPLSRSSPTADSWTNRSPTPSSAVASRPRKGWSGRALSHSNAGRAAGCKGPTNATLSTCRASSSRAAAAR